MAPSMPPRVELLVQNFAHIREIRVPVADLTLLVGPQATGKSLVLQLLKLIKDRPQICHILSERGIVWDSAEELSSAYLGEGLGKGWRASSVVSLGQASLTQSELERSRGREGVEDVYYIPAHRTLAIAEGWPKAFLHYQADTPFVARRFSETLLTMMSGGLGKAEHIFPSTKRLKAEFKNLIDASVFHGGRLELDRIGQRRQFVLDYGTTKLPFMAWTAGQREFIPLLLGLYHLLPAGAMTKKNETWVVIEEPEMGLHPRAVVAVMGAVLDLVSRGYKVAMSTHSATVLEVVWAMNTIGEFPDAARLLCKIIGVSSTLQETMLKALRATRSVVFLDFDEEQKVVSRDISRLDPSSAIAEEAAWGGLTSFTATVSEIIAKHVNVQRARSKRSRRSKQKAAAKKR